jgi:hypothetical protein
MRIDVSRLDVCSPKRTGKATAEWAGFFPYYAGFPETFATRLLKSACLDAGDHVLDPWNGSGTTTSAASALGIESTGIDINPAMVVIARARSLAKSEAISLQPLRKEIVLNRSNDALDDTDELLCWFGPKTAQWIRGTERAAREILLPTKAEVIASGQISAIASTYYVALFSLCRMLTRRFQSTNPTWLRRRKDGERRIGASHAELDLAFTTIVESHAKALISRAGTVDRAAIHLKAQDTCSSLAGIDDANVILTSPPYCTRIDYTAATRLALAVLAPLLPEPSIQLSRRMLGSTRVPSGEPQASAQWGPTCNAFLAKVEAHTSKASAGYYLKTHLDYFSKMHGSLGSITDRLAPDGTVVIVVQDSHYKEVHNNLPQIITEMAQRRGLSLERRDNFYLQRTLADMHPGTKNYRPSGSATEAVLIFQG